MKALKVVLALSILFSFFTIQPAFSKHIEVLDVAKYMSDKHSTTLNEANVIKPSFVLNCEEDITKDYSDTTMYYPIVDDNRFSAPHRKVTKKTKVIEEKPLSAEFCTPEVKVDVLAHYYEHPSVNDDRWSDRREKKVTQRIPTIFTEVPNLEFELSQNEDGSIYYSDGYAKAECARVERKGPMNSKSVRISDDNGFECKLDVNDETKVVSIVVPDSKFY